MADNSISRVYQFISNNYSSIDEWKKEIDERYGNKDGTVIKSEFNSFMLREFDFEENDNPNDIINKFWASIDTKTTGKVGGTGIVNVNALDIDELEKAEVMLQLTNKIGDFLDKKEDVKNYKSLGITNIDGWKNSIKEGMMNKLASQNIELEDESKLQELMERAYQQTVRKATADYVKDDVIEKEIKNNSAFSDIDYASGSDKELKKVIERYIKSLDSDEKTPLSQIVSDVTTLVQAYADTAKTNSQTSVDAINKYGYSENGKLNDLQMAVLVKGITDGIDKKLDSPEYSALKASYGDMITAKIKPYIENALKGKKASEFTTIKDSISTYVDRFFTSEIADIQKEYDECQAAKKELKDLLADKYTNDKYKAAIKEVFGKETKADVEAIIDGYKTKAEVDAAKAAIEAKFAIEDAKIDANDFFKDLKSSYTVFANNSVKVAILPTYYNTHKTGSLKFSSSNKSLVAVDSSNGTVTIIAGSIPNAEYPPVTISVTDATTGNVLATKTIESIKVLPDLTNDNSTFDNLNKSAKTSLAKLLSLDTEKSTIRMVADENHLDDQMLFVYTWTEAFLLNIEKALVQTYPECKDQISKAIKTTINYYKAACEMPNTQNDNQDGKKSGSISYNNELTGKRENETISWAYKASYDSTNVDEFKDVNGFAGDSGIYVGDDQDKCSADQYFVWLDQKVVVQKFLSFLGSASF